MRRNAVFHIMTVIFCLIINGFCFWLTEKMQDQQNETRSKKGKKILVQFDVSYYLIVIASGLSILATAFTLIRRYPSDEDEQLERLLEEYTGFEEPIHLERSLPASVVVPQHQNQEPPSFISTINPVSSNLSQEILNQDYYFYNVSPIDNNSSNNNNTRQINSSRNNRVIPPLPPATPPPQLSNNLILNANEPPPPYDPTTVAIA